MKVAVHQPNFLPYLGFFDKARQVDVFVILDDVQFTHGGFTNRNQIKTPQGTMWLTVPIQSMKLTSINRILIARDAKWRRTHLKSYQHMYGKAVHYELLESSLIDIYNQEWEYLLDFNFALLKWCFELLEINVDVKFSSTLKINATTGTERIIKICRSLGSTDYLSGASGRKYLDFEQLNKEKINVSFHNFDHPVYPQLFGDFIPNLSRYSIHQP